MTVGLATGLAALMACETPLTVAQPEGSELAAPARRTPVASIVGVVYDTAFRPLEGVTVQVAGGPHAGATATTSRAGEYVLPGPFTANVPVRALLDGYMPATQTVTLADASSSSAVAGFALTPFALARRLEPGDYELTLAADAACADIPAGDRTLSFAATVRPASTSATNTQFVVSLVGTFPAAVEFDIGAAGDTMSAQIISTAIVKAVAPGTYLEFEGTGSATIHTPAASSVTFDFDGTLDYCALSSPMAGAWSACELQPKDRVVAHASCASSHHRLMLVRRVSGR